MKRIPKCDSIILSDSKGRAEGGCRLRRPSDHNKKGVEEKNYRLCFSEPKKEPKLENEASGGGVFLKKERFWCRTAEDLRKSFRLVTGSWWIRGFTAIRFVAGEQGGKPKTRVGNQIQNLMSLGMHCWSGTSNMERTYRRIVLGNVMRTVFLLFQKLNN